MTAIKLRGLPVTVNARAIAEGVLEEFDDEERTVLRFGMLPAKKMEVIERVLRNKFAAMGTAEDLSRPDVLTSIVTNREDDRDVQFVEWSLNEVVSDAVHAITIELYRIGDLVV